MANLYQKILRASFLVAAAHLLLKFSGLIQARCLTQFLPADIYEPVMVVAFSGVLNTLFLIGQELIHPVFLTVFMQEKEDRGEAAAWEYANSTLSLQSLILLLATATIVCFPDFYIHLFTNWTPQDSAYSLLRHSLRILAPALFFLSLGSTTYVILNGYKKFFLAAFGDASTKICIVLGLLVGMGIFGLNYHVLLFGIVVGAAAKVVTHLIGLGRQVRWLRWKNGWSSPAFRSMLWLMLPLLAGILFAKVRDNFNNIYILTHLKQNGVLMANDLGRRLYSSLQWLVPYALQIALFPYLCELVSKNDRQQLGAVLERSCRWMLEIFFPLAVLLAIVSRPLAILLFCGGKMGLEIATWTGVSMACYTLVLPASAMECVLMQGFFADRRTISVTVIGLACSSLSVFISWYFIVCRGVTAQQSLIVVALGFTLSRFLKSAVLAGYMSRKVPFFTHWGSLLFLGKVLLITIFSALSAYFALRWSATHWPMASDGKVLYLNLIRQLVCSGGAGGLVWLLGLLPTLSAFWKHRSKH